MFGYVQPEKPELRIKEYETYKAIYCSLCKTLGKEYGILSKALLTYDAVFYILFRKSLLQKTPDCAHRGMCRFNPLKKCNYIDSDLYLSQAAGLSVIMFYYKLLDNINDSGFLKKLGCYLVLPYIKLKFKKALKKYSQFNAIIKASVCEQSAVESVTEISVDRACDPSAKALGEIFSLDITDSEQKENAYRVGYCIGRWVYLIDALDDIEKDLKNKSFNPFVNKYCLTDNNISQDTLNCICGSIRMSSNEAAAAFDRLDTNCYSGILENIIIDGTEAQLDKLINKNKERQNQK